MNIKTANTLFSEGIIRDMYRAGFLSNKFFLYREIYLWVDLQIKLRAISKSQAAKEAVSKFDKDERTIWRALMSFTSS